MKNWIKNFQKRLEKLLKLSVLATLVGICFWFAQGITTPPLPSKQEPLLLYSNQIRQDLGLTFGAALDRAQDSIFVSIYSLSDNQLITKLRQKADQGIHVSILCDADVSYRLEEKLGPKVRVNRRSALGLMHQKILIIDDEEVWIGSANLTPTSLRQHGNLVMGVRSAELAAEIGDHLSQRFREKHSGPHEFVVGGQKLELWVLPTDSLALQRLVGLIDTAKKTVRVAMFTWTHPELTEAVIRAHKRGLDVAVVIDYQSGSGTSGKAARKLQRYGVNVTLSDGMGLLHHKFAWIDDKVLAHGSANWTRSAFGRNDEVLTVLPELTSDQQRLMRRLWRVVQLESTPL